MTTVFRAMILMLMLLCAGIRTGAEEIREPEIRIHVMETGCKSASVAIDQPHRWLIRCDLPEVPGRQYTVTQTLPVGLVCEPGSITVRLPEGMELTMEKHYLFTAGTVMVEQGYADRICIELTEEGNALLASGGTLEITYDAKIGNHAPMGTQLLGTAQLRCRDSDGTGAVFTSDKAAVSTGGFHIRLTTSAGTPVPGGKFMLAREASPDEQEKKNVITEHLDIGTEILSVVYVPFRNASGEKAYTVETDPLGQGLCQGLAYGSYYLVQTELPEGWGLPANPVPVCVNEVSHLTLRDGWQSPDGMVADHTVQVVLRQLLLPESGGPGTAVFTYAGLAVVLSAGLLLWLNRRQKIAL